MVRWIVSSGSSLGYAWSRGRNEIQTEKSMVTQAIREAYLSAQGARERRAIPGDYQQRCYKEDSRKVDWEGRK